MNGLRSVESGDPEAMQGRRRLRPLAAAGLPTDEVEPDSPRYAFMIVSDDEGGFLMLGGRRCDSPIPRRPQRRMGPVIGPNMAPDRAAAHEAEPNAMMYANQYARMARRRLGRPIVAAPDANRDTEPAVTHPNAFMTRG